jgi:thiol-disulfide isomerase/thioredoxin
LRVSRIEGLAPDSGAKASAAGAPPSAGARRRLLALATVFATALASTAGNAAPPARSSNPAPQPFGPESWPQLRDALPRPAAVVFTATWCPHCPAVASALAKVTRTRGATLVVVVVDGAERPDLHHDSTYRQADRLLFFAGNEAALRHAVDPRWRGTLPYVALLGADGSAPVFVAGMPSTDALARWASRHSSPSSSGSS